MNLINSLQIVLEQLLLKQSGSIANDELVSCIDLTLLNKSACAESIIALNDKAIIKQVAAICIFSEQLPLIHGSNDRPLNNQPLLATVINFPQGNDDIQRSLSDIDQAMERGAQEIDYVFPYEEYLSGRIDKALECCASVAQYCQERQLSLKIIIESGVFSNMDTLYQAARSLIDMGIDFLKTSTGTIEQGASLSAAFTLLSAIKDAQTECGIKISGGVKTPDAARNYAYLAELMLNKPINKKWFRIGASSLLEQL